DHAHRRPPARLRARDPARVRRRPRPGAPVRALVRRGAARGRRRAQRDDAGHRRRGRPAVRAHGAPQGRGHARLRLLLGLPQPQGRRARAEPPGRARALLGGAGAAGAYRRHGGADRGRGERGVLPQPATREPRGGVGLAPEPADRRSGRARAAVGRARRGVRDDGAAAPAALGGLPGGARRGRVLAGALEPPARPDRVPARGGGRVAPRAALAV
ncbi:MAG: Pyridoxamine 5'-phosphate oxidase, partial [uncultured Gemmatimonadaceae bacterium]